MKKKLFLIISTVIACVMIATLVFPSMAVEVAGETRSLSEHLTIHYDFRGDTNSEKLKDKATGGSSKDDLTIPSGKEGMFTFSNSSIEQNATMVNGYGVSVYADSSSDILATGQGEGTWFVRFRATTAGEHSLIDLRKMGSGRPLYVKLAANGTISILQASVTSPDSYQEIGSMNIGYDFSTGEWCNLYIQRYLYLGEYYHYKAYVSYGDSTELTASSTAATGWVVGNKTAGLTPTSYPLGLFVQQGQTWGTLQGLSYDDVRYYDVSLTENEMKTLLSDEGFCDSIGGSGGDEGNGDSIGQITYDRNDLNSCMILHYDFNGNTNATRLADKATAGTSDDDLVIKTGTDAAYTFSDGTVKLNNQTNTYLYAPASDDLVRANMGEGSWFARFSATQASATEWRVILDLRQNSVSRGFFLAMRPDGKLYIAASTGAEPVTGNQLNPVEGFQYTFNGDMINLFAVRALADGEYSYTLYYSVGDSTEFERIAKWVIGSEEAGLASTKNIPLGIYNQANVTWPSEPGMTIDDIRYYVVPLTVDEMGTVIENLDESPETPPGQGSNNNDTNNREPETTRPVDFCTVAPDFDPGVPKTPAVTTEEKQATEAAPDVDTEAPTAENAETEAETEKTKRGCSSHLALSLPVLLIVCIMACLYCKKKKSDC